MGVRSNVTGRRSYQQLRSPKRPHEPQYFLGVEQLQIFSGDRGRRVATVTAATLASAAAYDAGRSASPRPGAAGELGPLTDIAVRRLLLGDKVAAAKFGTGRPVDDPAREREELGSVAVLARNAGIDPDAGVRFFQAQIEANKMVQRGLHALWAAHPGLRPGERPDLAAEVRPELDRITTEIMRELRATRHVRGATEECRVLLLRARLAVEPRVRLDTLHREALSVALRPICVP
jgi:chorismate mutase